MRRIYALLVTLFALLLSVLPALAAEGDPLEEAVLLPGWFAFMMVVIALVFMAALYTMSHDEKK